MSFHAVLTKYAAEALCVQSGDEMTYKCKIAMSLCDIDLYAFAKINAHQIQAPMICQLIREIGQAIVYLHLDLQIMHRYELVT